MTPDADSTKARAIAWGVFGVSLIIFAWIAVHVEAAQIRAYDPPAVAPPVHIACKVDKSPQEHLLDGSTIYYGRTVENMRCWVVVEESNSKP